MAEINDLPQPLKLAITYRVIWHWRLPIFQRLASQPNYEVRVFHGADFPGTTTVNASRIEGVPHVQMFTIRWLSRLLPLPEWPICPTLLFHLWRFRPDVILSEANSNLLNNFQVFFYAGLTKTPVVFWTLGALRGKTPRSTFQRIYRSVTRWMENRSAALLGYSSNAIDYFQQQGYPPEKQFKAVNVVDTDRVQQRIEQSRDQVEPLRDQLRLHDQKVILFVGAVTREKRLEDLIEAFEAVHNRLPNTRLVIVGDGPHMPQIRESVASSPVGQAIDLTGKVIDGVSAYFLLGDIFVLPHLGGLSISEAMAHGLPVIATIADGCELDLIESGGNGYLIPVGQPAVLAETMMQLLADDVLCQRMKDRSREIIAHQYNVHTYVQGINDAVAYAARQGARTSQQRASVVRS